MATRILGIDIGHFSVKLALIEAGFRNARLVGFYEKELQPDENSTSSPKTWVKQSLEILQRLLRDHSIHFDQSVLTLTRSSRFALLSFPFSDRKKIEQLLPFELEGELLKSPDEEWMDFCVLPRLENNNSSLSSVFAALIRKDETQELLKALKELKIEPRLLTPSALSTSMFIQDASFPKERPLFVIDLGHRFTQVCGFYHPTLPGFARNIDKGGHQLTLALAQAQKISYAAAQSIKHQANLFPSITKENERQAEYQAQLQHAQILQEALRPFIRELRQTFSSALAQYGVTPQSIILMGGGSELRGIAPFLENELGIQTQLWDPHSHPAFAYFIAKTTSAQTVLRKGASATLLALGTGRAPLFNFRKAERSQQTDFLRSKIPGLAASFLAITLCGALSLFASYLQLKKENTLLEQQFSQEVKLLLGEKSETDPNTIIQKIDQTLKKTSENLIPSFSAYDLLKEISAHTPTKNSQGREGHVNVKQLTINSSKIGISGWVDKEAGELFIDEWVESMHKVPCLKSMTRKETRIETMTLGGEQSDRTRFVLEGNNECLPKK